MSRTSKSGRKPSEQSRKPSPRARVRAHRVRLRAQARSFKWRFRPAPRRSGAGLASVAHHQYPGEKEAFDFIRLRSIGRSLKRGDLVTVAANFHTGKPRPAVPSIGRLPASLGDPLPDHQQETEPVDLRIRLDPDHLNGLQRASWIMVDKILTVPREQIGQRFGQLMEAQVALLDQALAVFLDLRGA
jgi:mRNA interferase MazF